MKKLALLAAVFLLPALLCLGMGFWFGAADDAFAANAETVKGTVQRVEHRTRSNGRDSEDITVVVVSYKTRSDRELTGDAEVGTAIGLSPGQAVDVLYAKDDFAKIQIRAGFLNRSSKVVFFTFFGAFWMVLALGLLVLGGYLRRMALGSRGRG